MASGKHDSTRKVLIAVDESPNSKFAFNFYLKNVAFPNDEVVLVHIFNPPQPPTMSSRIIRSDASYIDRSKSTPFGHDIFLTDEKHEQWVKWRINVNKTVTELKNLLQTYEKQCDDRKIQNHAILHSGTPGEAICELADQHGVALILMGSRGLNKIRRTFIGSVTDYISHHASQPLIVVPFKDKSK